MQHRSLVNIVTDNQLQCKFLPEDVFIQSVSISFDVSMCDFFVPFSVGACVVPAGMRAKQDAAQFLRQMVAFRVTVAAGVPSELQLWLASGLGRLPGLRLRWLVFGGEALPPVVLQNVLRALPGCQMLFIYGPTEVGFGSWLHIYVHLYIGLCQHSFCMWIFSYVCI